MGDSGRGVRHNNPAEWAAKLDLMLANEVIPDESRTMHHFQ